MIRYFSDATKETADRPGFTSLKLKKFPLMDPFILICFIYQKIIKPY